MAKLMLLLIQSALWGSVVGVTLSPCGTDNTAEVVKGKTDNTITCTGLTSGEVVDWYVFYNNRDTAFGYCPAVSSQACVALVDDALTPSRVSSTASKMVIDATETTLEGLFKTGTLRCADQFGNQDSCKLDYIDPAQGSCTIQAGTGSSRFRLDARCTMQAGASSARNRYKCEWSRTDGQQKFSVSLTGNNYQTGCVSTDEALPTVSGQYTYTVTLIPGRNTVTAAGTIDITRPVAPSVSDCGGDTYIPENTNVTCTCTTNSIGQPLGRLRWEKVGDSSVIKVGNYGAKSLTLSQTLQRGDHQSTRFWCSLEWTSSFPGPTLKFNVGYPPTRVTLQLNSRENDLTVSEHQSVDFGCSNGNGRPAPTLSLMMKDNSTVLSSKLSALNHVVTARCEDSGQYVCTAGNGMGPVFTGTPKSLTVKCSPRGTLDVGELNFIDDPVSLDFNVTAYPVPGNVTFLYLGPTGNATNPTEVDSAQITLTGQCSSMSGVVYQSLCSVTVNKVTSEAAAGFYRVMVNNSEGSGQFRLKILFRAPVTPDPHTGDDDDNETPTGAIAGGVIAAVVVIIAVVVVVIFFVRRRRKDPAKEKLEHPAGRSIANGGSHDGALEGLDNPALQHDPEQPEATPSSRYSGVEATPGGGYLYAVVNKPKKPAATTATAGTSNSAEPVYQEVDKTKKKKKKAAPPKPEPAADKNPQATPRKGKGKKTDKGGEAHIYGNVDPQETKGKKGKKPQAMPVEEKKDDGKTVNPDGLVYTSVDFEAVPKSSEPPPKPVRADQGVLYSDVDFAKSTSLQE